MAKGRLESVLIDDNGKEIRKEAQEYSQTFLGTALNMADFSLGVMNRNRAVTTFGVVATALFAMSVFGVAALAGASVAIGISSTIGFQIARMVDQSRVINSNLDRVSERLDTDLDIIVKVKGQSQEIEQAQTSNLETNEQSLNKVNQEKANAKEEINKLKKSNINESLAYSGILGACGALSVAAFVLFPIAGVAMLATTGVASLAVRNNVVNSQTDALKEQRETESLLSNQAYGEQGLGAPLERLQEQERVISNAESQTSHQSQQLNHYDDNIQKKEETAQKYKNAASGVNAVRVLTSIAILTSVGATGALASPFLLTATLGLMTIAIGTNAAAQYKASRQAQRCNIKELEGLKQGLKNIKDKLESKLADKNLTEEQSTEINDKIIAIDTKLEYLDQKYGDKDPKKMDAKSASGFGFIGAMGAAFAAVVPIVGAVLASLMEVILRTSPNALQHSAFGKDRKSVSDDVKDTKNLMQSSYETAKAQQTAVNEPSESKGMLDAQKEAAQACLEELKSEMSKRKKDSQSSSLGSQHNKENARQHEQSNEAAGNPDIQSSARSSSQGNSGYNRQSAASMAR